MWLCFEGSSVGVLSGCVCVRVCARARRPACSVCSGGVAALEKELNSRVCLAASGWSTAACCIIIFGRPSPPHHSLLQRQPEGGEQEDGARGKKGRARKNE